MRTGLVFGYRTAVTPAVTIDDLTVRYGGRLALDHVTLQVDRGSTTAIIGPNGSGKSTLLRAIAGLAPAATGTVTLHGVTVALVLQATDVDRTLPITVHETVRMARYAHRGLLRRLQPGDHAVVQGALARLDIEDLAHRQLHDLSGGQRQRVFVAQGLAQEADILLLDEPVTGLDVVSRRTILQVIEEERSAGRSVLMTTHDLDDASRCDRVLLLSTGAVAYGPPDEVLVESHLREAFGGRVLLLAGGDVFVDDPHHAH